MITVSRRSYIESITPEQLFAALSDPALIGQLLPRVQKVEMLSRNEAAREARLATHMSMGGIFGSIRCEGDLTWQEPHEIVFKVLSPLPVETKWLLKPRLDGTEIQASMGLDLAPMLGPLAAFVPPREVGEILTKELDAALKTIAERLAPAHLHERMALA